MTLRPPRVIHPDRGVFEASWNRWVLPLSFGRFEALVPGAERVFALAFEVERDDGYRFMDAGGPEIGAPSGHPVDGEPMV